MKKHEVQTPAANSTRGRIVDLLRRAKRTVNELAALVGLTDNAVRAHLAALEKDGLVCPSGTRPGTRRPNVDYDLTEQAQQLFSKAYAPVLQALVETLHANLSDTDRHRLFREVGVHLAAPYDQQLATLELSERIQFAGELLVRLGAIVELEHAGDTIIARGCGCPLAAAVAAEPSTCLILEAFLARLLGVRVQEKCAKADRPCCRFEIGPQSA